MGQINVSHYKVASGNFMFFFGKFESLKSVLNGGLFLSLNLDHDLLRRLTLLDHFTYQTEGSVITLQNWLDLSS